ncbi:hypothetical protein ABRQ01_12125 [Pectobacterium aroidearum]|uniref:hypothetical protein n=1 Tax=Pectobacterium aroidearum TaxID=1201031 RepID=UPI0032F06407
MSNLLVLLTISPVFRQNSLFSIKQKSTMSSTPELPAGWEYANGKKQQALLVEYQLELPTVHPLHGVDIDVIAYRDGNDDILLKQTQETDCVSVVHLTWAMQKEFANFPRVEFTGSFQEFVQWEYLMYGAEPEEG